jgi:hypothetical protein
MQAEINDYLDLGSGKSFFARDTAEAIHILNTRPVNLVVLQINNLLDAAILKYINENYAHLEVMVLASPVYDDIITVFSKCHFRLFRQPLHLSELKENIESFHPIES